MMTRRQVNTGLVAGIAAASISSKTYGQEKITFPAAKMQGGMPLMSALKARHSTREYSDQPLPLQILSDLLWAAFGVNRPNGDRTAPYWRHIMAIDVYAVMAEVSGSMNRSRTACCLIKPAISANRRGPRTSLAAHHSTSSTWRTASA